MAEKSNENLFSFQSILKISFPVMIILGVTDLTSYYYQFKVPIIEYLQFGEIITLFLRNTSYYFLLVLPVYFVYDLAKYQKISNIKIFTTLGLSIILSVILMINRNFYFDITIELLTWMVSNITIMVIALYLTKNKVSTDDSSKYLFLSFGYFSILLLGVSIKGIKYAHSVKKYNVFHGTEVVINNSKILSDSNIYYIGKTEKYIYFFDRKNESPIIYPIEKLDKIEIKSKRIEH